MRDNVKVADRLRMLVKDKASDKVIEEFLSEYSGDRIHAKGFVSLHLRERGKIVKGSKREGSNIWTLSGREHLAQLQSYRNYSTSAGERRDRIRYIGFGTGSQPEVSSVSALVNPIAFDGSNNFLAQVALPTYPLAPSRTTVRYSRVFEETELSVLGTVVLTEAGLFTDGDPGSDFSPGTRNTSLPDALLQAPNGYKVFEPLTKTQNFVLEVSWEVRF
jgi:hypothetical protein